jgi:hypothetical protein
VTVDDDSRLVRPWMGSVERELRSKLARHRGSRTPVVQMRSARRPRRPRGSRWRAARQISGFVSSLAWTADNASSAQPSRSGRTVVPRMPAAGSDAPGQATTIFEREAEFLSGMSENGSEPGQETWGGQQARPPKDRICPSLKNQVNPPIDPASSGSAALVAATFRTRGRSRSNPEIPSCRRPKNPATTGSESGRPNHD